MYEKKYSEPEYPASAPPVADVTQHKAVAALLARRPDLIKTTATCIICHKNRSEVLGVFVWNTRHAKVLGITENFPERRFLYGMCEGCFEHPSKAEILTAIEHAFVEYKGLPAPKDTPHTDSVTVEQLVAMRPKKGGADAS
jgi:hypothetical protein